MVRSLIAAVLIVLLFAQPVYAQSQPEFYEEAAGRGLNWHTKGSAGGAAGLIDGTKFRTSLHGSQQVTIEVKADIRDASGGPAGEAQWRLAIAPVGNTGMSCLFNGTGAVWTGYDLEALGSSVWHCVWSTALSSPAGRVRLLLDGVDQGDFVSGSPPAQNETLDLGTGRRLSIGNTDLGAGNGVSSMNGRIAWVAYFSRAMPASEALGRATDLLADDDTSPGTTPTDPTPTSVIYVGEGVWQASATVATLTPGLPVGLASTDQALVVVVSRTTGTPPTFTFPTEEAGQSWELVETCHSTGTGGAIALEVWKKNGTAPATAPAITINTIGFGWSAVMLAYRNTPGPVDAVTSSGNAAQLRTPLGATTVNPNTRFLSIVAAASETSAEGFALHTPNGFTGRLTGSPWSTARGPHRIGMADVTKGDPGAVTMPTWRQEGTVFHPWCDIAVALDLITTPVPPPPPQGGGPAAVQRFFVVQPSAPVGLTPVTPIPLP